jgi:hypothetical protein
MAIRADIDENIQDWMKAKGWEVTRTPEYDSKKRVVTWFHEPQRGPAISLGISREVLDDFPPWALLYHLDQLKVATAIGANPGARLVVVQKGTEVVIEEVPGE